MSRSDAAAILSLLLAYSILLFLVGIALSIISRLGTFIQELRRLNGKIRHSRGAKRKHLLRRRRRLWLSLLPFIKY